LTHFLIQIVALQQSFQIEVLGNDAAVFGRAGAVASRARSRGEGCCHILCPEERTRHLSRIAGVQDVVDVAISSEDAEQSKPAPDIFQVVLRKLAVEGHEAVAIGDTPYDAEAAGKAGIPTIGMLRGGFSETELRKAGCAAVYRGPGALLACFGALPLGASTATTRRSESQKHWTIYLLRASPFASTT
jgi:beta-phosphoglucomutase-like phosphatase (HAD superfamily)